MKLSIIVPVFNEEKTIDRVLKRLINLRINRVLKEIIVVDDGSTDDTYRKISNLKSQTSNIRIRKIKHVINQGKGAAVGSGLKSATGDYIIVQDADLEYDPKYIEKLLLPVLQKKAEVVYGTRLNRWPDIKRSEKTFRFFVHYLGNRCLSFLTSILYGQWITDMETGYKIFPRKALKKIRLTSKGFGFEPELTAKLLKAGYKILELPISTKPRGYEEGKKLHTVRDGVIALWILFKYRLKD